MGYIYSTEEMEETARRKKQEHQEYLEWIERLPQPFKFIYQNRFFFAALAPLALVLFLSECGKPQRQTIDPAAANAAIEQTRPSASQTALPASSSLVP